jgi:hypothetical protein
MLGARGGARAAARFPTVGGILGLSEGAQIPRIDDRANALDVFDGHLRTFRCDDQHGIPGRAVSERTPQCSVSPSRGSTGGRLGPHRIPGYVAEILLTIPTKHDPLVVDFDDLSAIPTPVPL